MQDQSKRISTSLAISSSNPRDVRPSSVFAVTESPKQQTRSDETTLSAIVTKLALAKRIRNVVHARLESQARLPSPVETAIDKMTRNKNRRSAHGTPVHQTNISSFLPNQMPDSTAGTIRKSTQATVTGSPGMTTTADDHPQSIIRYHRRCFKNTTKIDFLSIFGP
jgi:hypothetical protein